MPLLTAYPVLYVTLGLASVNLTYICAFSNNKKHADWKEKSKYLSPSEVSMCSYAMHAFSVKLLIGFLYSNKTLVCTITAQIQKASGENRNVTG